MKHWLIRQFNKVQQLFKSSNKQDQEPPMFMRNLLWQDKQLAQGYNLILAKWEDLAHFEDLQKSSYESLIWRMQEFQKDWRVNPYALYLVIKDQEHIIAMLCGRILYKDSHISHVVVHPEYQSQGLGKVLVEEFQQIVQTAQSQKITLEVRESNQIAQHLYQSLGFEAVRERPNYYYDNDETAIIMQWQTKGLKNGMSSSSD